MITTKRAVVVPMQLMPMLRYLGRLRDRFRANGFQADEPLFQFKLCACDAAFALSTKMRGIAHGSAFGTVAPKETPGQAVIGNDGKVRINRGPQAVVARELA